MSTNKKRIANKRWEQKNNLIIDRIIYFAYNPRIDSF